ncbi:Metallophosphoesterase 1 [Phytophthora cinnamomi]|uniref:Metallophosphoesterase 1 n=1 Tax=Phytophthora cinnamomi TaxID=4785 RepID=UPI003559A473|nr:Metallophosphoesterase 1 [Phytophthora cinnamomi]
MDSDVASQEVKTEARSFLESANFADLRARTTGSVILLTHLPLFRVDDLQCGEERLREAGHITYEHPSFKYETHHHVLSRELSAELLDKVQPDLVLSGHTHAWCAYQHPDGPSMEYCPHVLVGTAPTRATRCCGCPERATPKRGDHPR